MNARTRRSPSVRRPHAEALETRALLASVVLGGSSLDPITALTIADDGSFQVHRDGLNSGQAFPGDRDPADAGIFLRSPDGTVVGLDTVGRRAANYRTGTGTTLSRGLFPLSLTVSDDGRNAILVADNRNDGNTLGQYFQLTQITSYRPGADFFRVDNTIVNLGTAPITLDVFAAADLFVADDDFGVGFFDAGTGAVGGSNLEGGYTIFVQPNPGGGLTPTHFQGGYFRTIWDTIGGGGDLNDQVPLPTGSAPWSRDDLAYTDDGAALEWQDVTVLPGGQARVSYFWSFGGAEVVPPGQAPAVSPLTLAARPNQVLDGAVATFTVGGSGAALSDFLATVSWGDGSALQLARVQARGGGGFEVLGTHAYAVAGEYGITVTVIAPDGAAATVRSTARVADDTVPPTPPPSVITGDLGAVSDSGALSSDRVTNDNTPTFVGNATVGSQWRLVAIAVGDSTDIRILGDLTAAANGVWSVTQADALPDGRYTVEARPMGTTAATAITTVLIGADRPLVIDTVAPRVIAVGMLPWLGLLSVQFLDNRSGLDLGSVGVSRFRLARAGRGAALNLRAVGTFVGDAGPLSVRVALASPRRLQGGRYTLTIDTGVRDIAGNALDGEFDRRFPSGNGRPGGTFEADLTTTGRRLVSVSTWAGNRRERRAGR